jgi:hypothetical protein
MTMESRLGSYIPLSLAYVPLLRVSRTLSSPGCRPSQKVSGRCELSCLKLMSARYNSVTIFDHLRQYSPGETRNRSAADLDDDSSLCF